MDCSNTLSHHADTSGDGNTEPHLFLVLACDQPLAGGARYALGGLGEVIIGRGAAESVFEVQGRCRRLHLRRPDRWLSSIHARLTRVLGRWVMEDAGSKNGTLLNGVAVQRAELHEGDLLQVGHTFFIYREALPRTGIEALEIPPAGAADPEAALLTLVPALSRHLQQLRGISRSALPVLLLGESGTGKEVLARAIHHLSGGPGAFVIVRCGALSGALTESGLPAEAERGDAAGGTLFLDEISDLGPAPQAALLRIMHDAGLPGPLSAARQAAGWRVVCATHLDPETLVIGAGGALRADLYARLAGYTLSLPALRQRREDLGLLIAALLLRLVPERAAQVRLGAAAAQALLAHGWPQNVRELSDCLAAALTLSRGGTVQLEHLPETVIAGARQPPARAPAAVPERAAPAVRADQEAPVLVLEGEYWSVSYGGAVLRLKDSDGLRYLAYLIERPGIEVHAVDLLAQARRRSQAPPGEAPVGAAPSLSALGDAGPMLDRQAREAYRLRLADLRQTVEQASAWGDNERAARAQEEIDAIAEELARAVGLGGRDRKAASTSERARVNVTLRIRKALDRLQQLNPALGRHLDQGIRTGTFCSYT